MQSNAGDAGLGSTQRSKLDMSMRSMDKEGGLGGTAGTNDVQKELKLQDIQIGDLQKQIEELEQQNEMLRQQRPRVGKLPPLDGQNQMPHMQQYAGYDEDEDPHKDSPMQPHQ